MVTAAGTWAVAMMEGSAAQYNNFWQLFTRPARSTRWKLVTPPRDPSNGGLILADAGGHSLITGFRPSQDLTYTPLTQTRDGGQARSSASPLNAALANVPDALAAAPWTGRLLALLSDGTAMLAAPGYTSWSLASQRSLAATLRKAMQAADLHRGAFTRRDAPAGRHLRPPRNGRHLRPQEQELASRRARAAQATARHDITVLRLTRTASGIVTLLAAGTGAGANLLAAWSADNGSRWALSPRSGSTAPALTSTSFGPGGTAAIVLNGKRGQAHHRPGRRCPATRHATLAPEPAGGGFTPQSWPSGTSLQAPLSGTPSRSSSAHRADAGERHHTPAWLWGTAGAARLPPKSG